MRALGIDPSLTKTGVAIVDDGKISLSTIETKPTDADILSRYIRLEHIVSGLPSSAEVDVVVVEGPQFSRMQGSYFDRAGLWWLIIERFVPDVFVIEPLRLKRYVTGRGTSRGPNKVEKGEIISKLSRELDVEIHDDNQSDALGCALIGARLLGEPLDRTVRYRQDVIEEISETLSKDT